MKLLMLWIPSCIIFLVIAWRAWKTYKNGLFLALIQLCVTAVSAAFAYLITRKFLNPAEVDVWDLGKKLLTVIPEDFLLFNPTLEAFLIALPTALIALIVFSVLFEILRIIFGRIFTRLNRKHRWSEHCLHFHGSGVIAIVVGVLTAVLTLLMQLVPLGGISTVSHNALRITEKFLPHSASSIVSDALEGLSESPAIRMIDELGCRKMFYSLTTARRGEESFSVGEELLGISEAFTEMIPLLDIAAADDIAFDVQAISTLPETLTKTPQMAQLTIGMIRSMRDQLSQSDAIKILSQLMQVDEQRFADYFAQLTPDALPGDLQTFCDIAALLSEQKLIPKPGEQFDSDALTDQTLLDQVRVEILKNPALAAFFGIT